MANDEDDETKLEEAARKAILKKIPEVLGTDTTGQRTLRLAMAYTVLLKETLPGSEVVSG
jgi:hypothetical protein